MNNFRKKGSTETSLTLSKKIDNVELQESKPGEYDNPLQPGQDSAYEQTYQESSVTTAYEEIREYENQESSRQYEYVTTKDLREVKKAG